MNSIVPPWIQSLTGENFLAVYDVALDIRQASQMVADDDIVIPLWQPIIKFSMLMPMDSIGMRDRYCEFRWHATGMLKKHSVIHNYELLQGTHRWDSRLRIDVDFKSLNEFVKVMDAEYEQRSKQKIAVDNSADIAAASPFRDPVEKVRRLLLRFHAVVVQLRKRHDQRHTLDVTDEYDVQDLLRALLFLQFDDVRPEEWTPSYAGKASRVDFLLKAEKIVIEIKKTRQGLGGKEIGDELILDTARYAKLPDCSVLVCMVYDPENRITNPGGLEADLSGKRNGITVEVMIVPKMY
jgi:hypothetical protein